MSKVTIHADELIMALENHLCETQYYLDRHTGEVFPVLEGSDQSDEEQDRIEAAPKRFVFIEPIPSSVGWEVMEAFVLSLKPGEPRRRLERALRARHPFRSFKDEVAVYPDLLEAWYAFHDQELTKLAIAWLEDEEIDARLAPRPGFIRLVHTSDDPRG
ncbi:MAG: UPF0158 family protein [Acidobacteriota bacterium]